MENDMWSIGLFIATAVLAIATVIAAIFAWKSAKATQRTAYAQILMNITDAYASEEMLEGMTRLRRWKNEHPTNFAEKFAEMRRDEYGKIEQEDKARRRYSHHFHKIWLLFERELVDRAFVKKVTTKGQVEFLQEIIEPLEKAINPEYDHSTFDFFRGLYNKES